MKFWSLIWFVNLKNKRVEFNAFLLIADRMCSHQSTVPGSVLVSAADCHATRQIASIIAINTRLWGARPHTNLSHSQQNFKFKTNLLMEKVRCVLSSCWKAALAASCGPNNLIWRTSVWARDGRPDIAVRRWYISTPQWPRSTSLGVISLIRHMVADPKHIFQTFPTLRRTGCLTHNIRTKIVYSSVGHWCRNPQS